MCIGISLSYGTCTYTVLIQGLYACVVHSHGMFACPIPSYNMYAGTSPEYHVIPIHLYLTWKQHAYSCMQALLGLWNVCGGHL